MNNVAYTLDSGVIVLDIPESMALGYLARTRMAVDEKLDQMDLLLEELKRRIAAGGKKFVIDLSRLNHIDSAGVGMIVGFFAYLWWNESRRKPEDQ